MVPLNKFSSASENRRAATIQVVSTGSAERCRSQAGMNPIYGILVEPRGIEPLTSSLRTTRSPS